MHGRTSAPAKTLKATDSVPPPSWQTTMKKGPTAPPPDHPPPAPPRARSPSAGAATRARSPSTPVTSSNSNNSNNNNYATLTSSPLQPVSMNPVGHHVQTQTHTPSLFERLRARSPGPSRTRVEPPPPIPMNEPVTCSSCGAPLEDIDSSCRCRNSLPNLRDHSDTPRTERRTSRASEFANRILRKSSLSAEDWRRAKLASDLLSTETKIEGTKFSSMTTNVSAVYEQAQSGTKVVGAFKDLYVRLAKHEDKYARKLEKIMAEESVKITKAMENDRVRGFANVWESTATALRSSVDMGLKASQTIENDMVGTLSTLERHAHTKLKEIGGLVGRHEQDASKAVDALHKSQEEVAKAVSHMETHKEKSESSQYQLKLASLKIQAAEHAERLQETNKQLEFSAEGIGMLLDELQVLETQRVHLLLTSLETLLTTKKTVQAPFEVPLEVLRNSNATQCLHMFVADWVSEFGPYARRELYSNTISSDRIDQISAQTQVFEVPLVQLLQREKRGRSPVRDPEGPLLLRARAKSLFDCPGKHGLIAKIITEEGYACDVCEEKNIPLGEKMHACTTCNFYVCLDCNARPLPIHTGQRAAEVPVVLTTLCHAIRDMGGLQTEGIFRISVDSGLLNALRTQFNKADFSLDLMKGDPHAAACLLKLWLRVLPDPVMPRSVYAEVIEPFHRTGGGGKLGEEICLKVYRQLNLPYQALLKTILQLCQEVVANITLNRMSYEALSVVLTPCLFDASTCTDPSQIIAQSRHEQKFLAEFLVLLCDKLSAGLL